ncbi:hypothetical protein XELAEV_18017904mg [Xenopus laevis]|uniref:Uncharacterized protein n=1 Tax=Xenopus laevis TaxID=8355 RepID=A0A974HT23_XENLA|nr:hypothetical protein XELAEV_18017904mg [Xenopus laevis]
MQPSMYVWYVCVITVPHNEPEGMFFVLYVNAFLCVVFVIKTRNVQAYSFTLKGDSEHYFKEKKNDYSASPVALDLLLLYIP